MSNPDHESMLRKAAAGALPGMDFSGCDLAGIRLTSAKLSGLVFRGANICRADFSGAYLTSADLTEANLDKARLVLADLRRSKLQAASLKGADLTSAVLAEANLRDADLTNCKLTKALLTAADFTNANMAKADLRGVRGVTEEQIRSAKNWDKAVFDSETCQMLGLVLSTDVNRHGAPPVQRKAAKRKGLTIDVVCTQLKPTFGDLFLICGESHPRFPPSGNCNLLPLAELGFEQADDFFAIRNNEGDEIIWLYPLLKDTAVCHNAGPFDGVRLELPNRTKSLAPRFLTVVSAFSVAFQGTLRVVENDRAGNLISLDELGTLAL